MRRTNWTDVFGNFNIPFERENTQLDKLCRMCQKVLSSGGYWTERWPKDHDILDGAVRHHTWTALASSAAGCHLCALTLDSITHAIQTCDHDL